MTHLGDITKIHGCIIAPVDVAVGGSPCQDLSIAGVRAGMKHSDLGDEEATRSGLFMEQIRIIKELRYEDSVRGRTGQLIRPRFMVWENVLGAFSSNRGKDFRVVLEETARVAQPDAVIPGPPGGKWRNSGCILGDRWSIAWRVLDAQFWGVPQRRRRIALVTDFGGHAAPEVLFIRKGVSWDFDQGGAEGEGAAGGAEGGFGETGIGYWQPGIQTLKSAPSGGNTVPCVYENHGQDSRLTGPLEVAPTVARKFGTGGNNTPLVMSTGRDVEEIVCLPFDTTQITSPQNGCNPHHGDPCHPLASGAHPPTICMSTGQARTEALKGVSPTLNCNHEQPIVAHTLRAKANLSFREDCDTLVFGESAVAGMVRRLTPLECERLQGYPDGWTEVGLYVDALKEKERKKMVQYPTAWEKGMRRLGLTRDGLFEYRIKTGNDSARYKALGNSIAIPPWAWVMKRIAACYERPATLGSFFDGIGGFPLIWERLNGPGSCLWASEIEEFPIAVTKYHF